MGSTHCLAHLSTCLFRLKKIYFSLWTLFFSPVQSTFSVVAPIVMGTLIFQASLPITAPYTLLEQRNSFRRWV
ncbi:hypothetical protein ACE6H2_019003 [Prunus campanulata]